jgi:hypothetical protein
MASPPTFSPTTNHTSSFTQPHCLKINRALALTLRYPYISATYFYNNSTPCDAVLLCFHIDKRLLIIGPSIIIRLDRSLSKSQGSRWSSIPFRYVYILDWNFDEYRCRISMGVGPENMTTQIFPVHGFRLPENFCEYFRLFFGLRDRINLPWRHTKPFFLYSLVMYKIIEHPAVV